MCTKPSHLGGQNSDSCLYPTGVSVCDGARVNETQTLGGTSNNPSLSLPPPVLSLRLSASPSLSPRLQTGVAILAPEWLGFVHIVRAGIMDLNGPSPYRDGGWWCLYASFFATLTITDFEASLSPMTTEAFGWTPLQMSYLYTGLFVTALLAAVAVAAMGHWGIQDRWGTKS
jgi:hypothetical protein